MPRTCSVCRAEFVPFLSLQRVCTTRCAAKVPRLARAADRELTKKRRDALRPLSYWAKRAEAQVNRYGRLRDWHQGCISCDKTSLWTGGVWTASHFRSVGAAPQLRFHLWNINRACDQCNFWKAGNIADYEPRLRARIGDAKVDWLRTQNHVAKYSRVYLARVHDVFKKKADRKQKRIKNGPG